jgi:hypothetical protein
MPTFGLIKRDGNNGQSGHRTPHDESYDMRTAKVGIDNEFRKREPTRIGEFIQRQILGIQPGGQPVRLVLRHLGAGNQLGMRIGAQAIQNLTEEEVSAMALGIYDLAESDAIGLGAQSQKYALLSYDEDGPTNDPSGRCMFEVQTGMQQNTEQDRPGQYLENNPPNEVGVLGQVMAQNRDLLGKVLQVVSAASGSQLALQTQVDRLMNRLAEEETRRFQTFDTLEKARGEQWARERDAKLLDAELANKHEMIGLAKLAIPAILRRIGASDPKQRIEADDVQEINLALEFASDQNVFNKALEALPDEKSRVAFAEWVVFNAERAEKWRAEREGRAPEGSAAQLPQQQAAPQLAAPPPPPPSPEEVERARLAQIEYAKQEAAKWSAQIKALEAQRAAGAAAGQTPAPAQSEAAKPAATPTAAAPAPAPKRSHSKKKPASAPAPTQTEMPTAAPTPPPNEEPGQE